MECCIDSCDRYAYSQELCEPHYRRVQRHGDALADLPIGRALRTCSVPDCGRPCDGRGLCHGHYQRWQRTGDVGEDIPLGRRQPETCSANDCARPAKAKGLCDAHYKRALKHGDIQAERPIRVATGTGGLSHGYWKVPVPAHERHLTGGAAAIAEHRLVMARHLGRPLGPGEVVHHINGIRTDNRIENLELWSTVQPKGQRVEEKVAYALELLRRYRPDVLAEAAMEGAAGIPTHGE